MEKHIFSENNLSGKFTAVETLLLNHTRSIQTSRFSKYFFRIENAYYDIRSVIMILDLRKFLR